MKVTVAILALAGTLVYGALGAGTVAAQSKSQWDGVYTEAQAKRGEGLYAQYCATCHRPDGLGERRGPTDTDGYTVTPLWGPDSFNAAAGMARLPTAAAFVRANMPYGVTANEPLLSAQQAWDVAAYMLAQPRPNLAP